MPIYEYFCSDCQKSFDVFVRSLNAPITTRCPECGGEHIEKQVTAAQSLGANVSSSGVAATSCAPSG
jgi:putative FmdB family regulatory protein